MAAKRSRQERIRAALMTGALLLLLARILLGQRSGDAVRNLRSVTASLEMYPSPRVR